jgi:hypothetical protein
MFRRVKVARGRAAVKSAAARALDIEPRVALDVLEANRPRVPAWGAGGHTDAPTDRSMILPRSSIWERASC